MTKAPLVTGNEDTTLAEAQTIIQKHRIEKLPLVDKDGHLVGIITVKDIMKKRDYPDATHDDLGVLVTAIFPLPVGLFAHDYDVHVGECNPACTVLRWRKITRGKVR